MIALGEGLHQDVPMDVYHDNCCSGPSVSGSMLFRMDESCPARALAGHYLSPWPREEDETQATAIGIAAHTLILEGEAAFADRYAVKPEGMTFSTAEGKAWKAAHASKEIIRQADFEIVSGMCRAIGEHPAARNAFTGGRPEVTAIRKDPETGIWLKVRPDYLRSGLAINYKTTANASERLWTLDAMKFGYHVNAALAVDVLKALDRPANYLFVTQEKSVPFLCAVRVFDDALMQAGRIVYRRSLRIFADCISSGKWPGYGDDVSTVAIPPWLDRKLTNFESPL